MKSHEQCRQCQYVAPPEVVNQVFKDGRVHLRFNCPRCGAFIKYGSSTGAKTIREQCYDIVKNLAVCESREQFTLLRTQSRQVMDLIHKSSVVSDPEQVEMKV